jgi:hypothetical protein
LVRCDAGFARITSTQCVSPTLYKHAEIFFS